MNNNIVILIGFFPDPRFVNRIRTEKQAGSVNLICWDKGYSKLPRPKEDGYKLYIITEKAKGDPIRRFLPYKLFASKAMKLLKQIAPLVIHVQNLDMLQIAVCYKKRYNLQTKIIYEVADLHTLVIDEQRTLIRKAAQKYLINKEKKYSCFYDRLVLTSEAFYTKYFHNIVSEDRVVIMPNMPDLSLLDGYVAKDHNADFTVGFIGGIRYKDQIRNLIEAGEATGIKVLLAGYEEGSDEIEQLCKNKPWVEWIGRFNFKERGAELYGKCDAMYAVYNADMENVRVALPNKLYEAAWCEIPLFVAKNTYLAELVDEWGTGIAVDHKSSADLINEINNLRNDRERYNKIVEHCREKKKTIDYHYYEDRLLNAVRDLMNEAKIQQ